ncbi:MAG: tetratricopeptide repeat protein [Pyrinomonadaceae bacterium]
MKVAIVFLSLFLALACKSAAPPVANSTKLINAAQQTNEAQSVLAHSSENQPPQPVSPNSEKRSQTGGDPIDTKAVDVKIRDAELALAESKKSVGIKSKAGQMDANKGIRDLESNLADALFERGFALTEARQYASALGDYRRALKLDPHHEEAKKWIDQIMGIYKMLKRDPPKEGQEPPPLPFKKQA